MSVYLRIRSTHHAGEAEQEAQDLAARHVLAGDEEVGEHQGCEHCWKVLY